MTRRKPGRPRGVPKTRFHIQIPADAVRDLEAVAEVHSGNRSHAICVAMGSYLQCLKAGLVAVSGEILAPNGRSEPTPATTAP